MEAGGANICKGLLSLILLPCIVVGVAGVTEASPRVLGDNLLSKVLDIFLVAASAWEQDPCLWGVSGRSVILALTPHNVSNLTDDLTLGVLDASAVEVDLESMLSGIVKLEIIPNMFVLENKKKIEPDS